jgi:hypothetical protein
VIDNERAWVASKSFVTGAGDQSNLVAVGVDVSVKTPVAAVYESELGFANVVFGNPELIPSRVARATALEASRKMAAVVNVRKLGMCR